MARKVYEVHYRLKNAAGEVVDTSIGGEPLIFMEGAGQVVPGLEQAVKGREVGDALDVRIPPELGYGRRDPELVQKVPVSQFDDVDEVRAGMIFQTKSGVETQVVRVLSVEGDEAVVDANHPLAGLTLHFELQIYNVRDATAEEERLGQPLRA